MSQHDSLAEAKKRSDWAELDALNERIDRLTLLCEGMWDLVCETTGLSGEHLAHKLHALDMADGRHDDRRTAMAGECHCGAKVSPKAKLCQFCGAPPPARSAFDRV